MTELFSVSRIQSEPGNILKLLPTELMVSLMGIRSANYDK